MISKYMFLSWSLISHYQQLHRKALKEPNSRSRVFSGGWYMNLGAVPKRNANWWLPLIIHSLGYMHLYCTVRHCLHVLILLLLAALNLSARSLGYDLFIFHWHCISSKPTLFPRALLEICISKNKVSISLQPEGLFEWCRCHSKGKKLKNCWHV